MTFDSKCLDLANAFIEDHPELRPKAVDLAIEIAGAIEDWLAAQELIKQIDSELRSIADDVHSVRI